MRVALGIEYDGAPFSGWQHQAHVRSVQQVVEAALTRVADAPVRVTAAGRTDAGVHATGQVLHFDSDAPRSERAWVLGANSNLPIEVSVLWARQVPAIFDARRSALARSYRYAILNRGPRAGLASARATWFREPLDAARMEVAARALLGEHDFSAFRAASCQSRSTRRRVDRIRVWREREWLFFDITANAFLHHMVRNLAGALLEVGRGAQPPEWVAEVLAGRDRARAAPTAPAQGLYLIDVEYPAEFDLPRGLPPLIVV